MLTTRVILLCALLANKCRNLSCSEYDMNKTCQLLPSGRVSVCPEGQVTFVCTTNSAVHEWNISVPLHNYNRSKQVTAHSPFMNQSFPRGTIDLVAYVTRTSIHNSLPLISTLYLINVTTDLNGTVVKCYEHLRPKLRTALTGIIHVFNMDSISLNLNQFINTTVKRFGEENITVSLEMAHRCDNESVVPPVVLAFHDSKTSELTVNYNTFYNVSVTAMLCNHEVANTYIHLNFVKCDFPLRAAADSFMPTLSDTSVSLFLEGIEVSFECPPGFVLIGPSTARCMNSGKWQPDPRRIECKANCGLPMNNNVVYNSTLDGSFLNFLCEGMNENHTLTALCHKNGSWIPDPDGNTCTKSSDSGLTTLLTTILFTLFGIITVVAIFCCIAAAILIKTRKCGSCIRSKPSPENMGQIINPNPQNRYIGEYSLLQLSVTADEQVTNYGNEDARTRNGNLMYADIGPVQLSAEKRLHISTFEFDDNRVEYAQVNIQKEILPRSQEMEPKKSIHVDKLATVKLSELQL